MALRMIRKDDDPILKKVCKKVPVINERIKELLDDMLETLHDTPNGGALAANQIGILKRLIVIDLGEQVYRLVNPEIVEQSGEQFAMEGCLSFPDVWGKVRRPDYVKVEALNEEGESITVEGEGLMAQCLCHEIDHLNGITFVEKIEEYPEFE